MTKNVRIHIGGAEGMGQRFVRAWRCAEAGEAVDETHLTFRDLEALLAALTPKRMQLLRHVRHHQVESVRALAAELHRDYKNVHNDVGRLEQLGLLAREDGRVVAPYAEVDAQFVL
jgi:predicted transcriptional regulator